MQSSMRAWLLVAAALLCGARAELDVDGVSVLPGKVATQTVGFSMLGVAVLFWVVAIMMIHLSKDTEAFSTLLLGRLSVWLASGIMIIAVFLIMQQETPAPESITAMWMVGGVCCMWLMISCMTMYNIKGKLRMPPPVHDWTTPKFAAWFMFVVFGFATIFCAASLCAWTVDWTYGSNALTGIVVYSCCFVSGIIWLIVKTCAKHRASAKEQLAEEQLAVEV